jgi:hypothetical protein
MFNPFGKSLSNITEDDLQILLTVSEGWYIEYKGAIPESKKIAKSIASFSNSYGGLYLLGVESDRATNCAIQFPGVDINIDKIHDAVRGNLNPFPHFECYTVPVQNGRSVVIVAVEEGLYPPCIHNDGRIYRRQESSSDPIHETNRYSIDQLYEKAKNYKEKLEIFRTIDYGFCKGEDNQPYLVCYINPARIEQKLITDFGNPGFHQKILDIFNKEFDINEPNIGRINGKMTFNNVTLFSESIIIRNMSNMDIAYNTLTIELFKNGSMKFMLPIRTVSLSNHIAVQIRNFCNQNSIEGFDSRIIKWTPIYDLVISIIGVFINYIKFMVKEYNFNDTLEITFEGIDVWRICLFSETDSYLNYINKYSLPIVIKDNIKYPEKAFTVQIIFDNDSEASFIMSIFSVVGVALSGFGMPLTEAINIYTTEAKGKVLP